MIFLVMSNVMKMSGGSDNRALFKDAREVLKCDSNVCECLKMLELLKSRLRSHPTVNMCSDRGINIDMLNFLLDCVNTKWYRALSKNDEQDLFNIFYLKGNLEDAFLVLVRVIDESSFSFKLDKAMNLLETMIKSSAFGDLFIRQCCVLGDPVIEEIRADMWKGLASALVSLPERIANKYQHYFEIREVFLPSTYFTHVAEALAVCLSDCHQKLNNEIDCSLKFPSLILGRASLSGNAEQTVSRLVNFLDQKTKQNYVWRRISQKLFSGLPGSCIESVITSVIKKSPWYNIVSRLLGNSILENKQLHFCLTNKLLLIRTFDDSMLLQNLIGYLADGENHKKSFLPMFLNLLDVWGNKSNMKHRPIMQHQYLTKAVLVCIGHLDEDDIKAHKQDIMRLTMHAIESHLSNQSLSLRRMGMFTAECVTRKIDPDGPKLDFEYERDDVTQELEELLLPQVDPGMKEENSENGKCEEIVVSEMLTNSNSENQMEISNLATLQQREELDSDDDLEPFDMSNDTVKRKCPKPHYLRDCMAGLVDRNDPERTQICLETVTDLIRRDSIGLSELAVEMTKILLHLDNFCAIPNFVTLRFSALTSVAVQRPKQVSEYLGEQFYDRNYSIRQRLDILEVLVAASKELAQVKASKLPAAGTVPKENIERSVPTTENWKEIIEKRIDQKTRRFGKGRTKPEPAQAPNRFMAVAGSFFFPLIRHYDRKENTFDLLGSDFYVLGRLLFSLGMMLHACVNTPVAAHIGQILLEFVWSLHYHVEPYVRQAVIFCICMIVLSVPPHALVCDLQDNINDCRIWLQDVLSNDSDKECYELALQTLVLINNSIKQELQSNITEHVS